MESWKVANWGDLGAETRKQNHVLPKTLHKVPLQCQAFAKSAGYATLLGRFEVEL